MSATSLTAASPIPQEHIPYFDGWRGIAIILVLFGHFSKYHSFGGIGVTVFFVLSGVLMSRILFVDRMPLGLFYRRRLARIVPVLWLYVIVVFLVGWLALDGFSYTEFFSSALFLRTYFPDADIFKAAVPIHHLWSLNVEEHCYMFLSLVSLAAIRYGEKSSKVILSLASASCLIFFLWYKYHPPIAQSPFYVRTEVAAFPLLLSCAIYLWLHGSKIVIPSWLPVASFGAAITVATLSQSVLFSFVGLSLFLAISINTLQAAPVVVRKLLSFSLLRQFGVCSYSIYIWQQPFYFLRRYTNWEYANVAGLLATIIVASCSFYLFERPLRNWIGGKRQPLAGVLAVDGVRP